MPDQTSVILLAGGTGTRIGGDQAKQFIRIAGKPVLAHTYEALRRHLPEALIAIVAPVDALDQVRAMIKLGDRDLVVAGGSSRQASTLKGLKALAPHQPANVLIHDAARPFVSGQIIHDVLDALEKNEAVDVAIPTADTIIVERDGYIQSIPKRQHILRGQTPQAFRFRTLVDCYAEVGEERLQQFTDDCGIYLECHPMGKVRIVQGSEENFKITHPVDLVLADEMFRIRSQQVAADRPGIDARGKNVLIFGGTAGIGKAMADIMESAGSRVIARSRSNGCDIAREADVKLAISEAWKAMGQIDVVVNAAGLLRTSELATQDSQDIADQIHVNLLGAAWIAKWSHAPLKETRGTLVQFASSSYTRGRADHVVYAATKAAIVNMTQGLSEEWAADGIRVSCIVPGRTDTEMRRANFKGEAQDSLSNPYQVALGAARAACSPVSGQVERV
ncbi:2-C-methyl-D-erythritol 4-phosphate cytidylyltransferase [Ramlibacter sp. MAHUQ-53]|uniref:2-C-methyl-D-erythritol 4-phosphate cytidylyltransferase n=1 Tax=unclassified Ramlibacter TaxID=2617605 RepID=UPI003636C9D3